MRRSTLLSVGIALVLPAAAMAAPVEYTIDPAHTYPSLEMPHMGISVWRGKINQTTGSVTLDRDARTGTVDIAMDADSIDFGLDAMNEEARKPRWLDAAQFPRLTYTGTIRFAGDTPVAVDGKLTLRGQTHPVKLAIDQFRCIEHPMTHREVCGADAQADIDRAAFGMPAGNTPADSRIHLRIQVEARRK
jgi:polyisoprenoid-binding protein YceI